MRLTPGDGAALAALPAPGTLFAALAGATGIVVAVSGGPDSVALLHLLSRWQPAGARPPLVVATVDHGLRPEAAAEAALVSQIAEGLGLPHRILPWTGPKPAHGLQEAAREARYGLLVALAREVGASHLVTAHTLDDQAETVLMRLSRGSGLSGLAGMRPAVERGRLCHLRPLLGVSKAALVALCRAEHWPFVDDPSNRDERYTRVRWRGLLPALAPEGLTAERLARLAARVRRADEALDATARDAFARARQAGEGGLRLDARALFAEPAEIVLRVLALACAEIQGAPAQIRLDRLETCAEALRQAACEGRSLRRTLAGALVALDRHGEILLTPEPPRRRGRYLPAEPREPILAPTVTQGADRVGTGGSSRSSDDAAAPSHSLGKGEGHA